MMKQRLTSNCPHCHQHASRVQRRLLDRLRALFVPAWRYRCDSLHCGWEGLLRRNPLPARPPRAHGRPRYAQRRVLEPARGAQPEPERRRG